MRRWLEENAPYEARGNKEQEHAKGDFQGALLHAMRETRTERREIAETGAINAKRATRHTPPKAAGARPFSTSLQGCS